MMYPYMRGLPTYDPNLRVRDIFMIMALAGSVAGGLSYTFHFADKHGATTILESEGYRSIEIEKGPSLRRGDCDGFYLTHFHAVDKNGTQRQGAVCHSMFNSNYSIESR